MHPGQHIYISIRATVTALALQPEQHPASIFTPQQLRMRHCTATLALGTCVLWLLVAASAARLDEQHLLSHENIQHGASRISNDCDLDYYCRHDRCRPGCDRDRRCKEPAGGLPHKICLLDNTCASGRRASQDCATGEICSLNECQSRPTCDLRRGGSPCTGTNKQIAFFPGTFTQDQCDAACREASTNCRSFAVATEGGLYGCYLYNRDVSICGGLPGAGNWAYSDRNCPHSWTRPVGDLKGGSSDCTNSPR